MNRRAVDPAIDQEMRDVDTFRPELPRQVLRRRAQSRLGRRECREPRTAPQAGGGSIGVKIEAMASRPIL